MIHPPGQWAVLTACEEQTQRAQTWNNFTQFRRPMIRENKGRKSRPDNNMNKDTFRERPCVKYQRRQNADRLRLK